MAHAKHRRARCVPAPFDSQGDCAAVPSKEAKLDAKGIVLESLGLIPRAGQDAATYNEQEKKQNQITSLHKVGKKIAVEPLEPLASTGHCPVGQRFGVWEALLQPLHPPGSDGVRVEGPGHLVPAFTWGWGYSVGLIPELPGH